MRCLVPVRAWSTVVIAILVAGALARTHHVHSRQKPKVKEPLILPGNPAADNPQVWAQSGIILDEATGRVLWQSNADEPMFPASTTKVMTALLLIENVAPDAIVTAPAGVDKIEETSMHLKPGETLTMRDLLYGLMLRSANDAAVTAAYKISGSVPSFAELMNKRAKELGCTNAHFMNPNGLPDPNHKVSAHDLALIAQEAMKYPLFREVVKTQKYQVKRSINTKDTWMVNRNKWLKKDWTADGIKTGFTKIAGHCYVGSATRDGFRVITVVMKTDHWLMDHQNMLNWAYYHFHKADVPLQETDVPVSAGTAKVVTAEAKLPVAFVLPKKEDPTVTYAPDLHLTAPVRIGQQVGTAIISDSSGFKMEVPLLATKQVDERKVLMGLTKSSPSLWIGAVVLVGGGLLMKSRRRSGFYAAPIRKF